jgi:hypothetical protein
MPRPRSRQSRRRGDLRWFLLIVSFFAYLLLLTWERMEVKERSTRIESLEQTLQQKLTDQALLKVELARKTGFIAVRHVAETRGLRPAELQQRFLLAADWRTSPPAQDKGPFRMVMDWLTQSISGGVAVARPSAAGAGDAEAPR